MKNGFRQQPQSNRKEKLANLDTRLANLEMSSRISQMMTQQLMQNMRNMQEDLGRSLGIISELQYKILAVQEASGLDLTQLNAIANGKRLKDFDEASDREDADKGFTVGTAVDDKSTVIITSKTEGGADAGIFRSRIELARCGVPDLITAFTGREVGAKALIKLNGVEHEVELLAIRQPSPESLQGGTAPGMAAGHPIDVGSAEEQDSTSHSTFQTQGPAELVGNA
jgi:hypothetical protein